MNSLQRKWWAFRIRLVPWLWDSFICAIWEMGCCGIEIKEEDRFVDLLAYWPEAVDPRSLVETLESWKKRMEINGSPQPLILIETKPVEEGQWMRVRRGRFKPIRVTEHLMVSAPWETPKPGFGVKVIKIKPGQAFGTGLHETTRMCLFWLDHLLTIQKIQINEALDLGTGTGILAIAMAKLGVRNVWALDTDPLAIKEAEENVRRNRVQRRVAVLQGSLERVKERKFSIMAANLTAEVLQEMSWDILHCLSEEGRLILSGILKKEAEGIRRTFQKRGMVQIGKKELGEWVSILMGRRGESA